MKKYSPRKAGRFKQQRRARFPERSTANKASAKPMPMDRITVAADERRHLIEDVAFFRAERYRRVDPGRYRQEDRREAEADIAEVFEEHGVR